MTKAFVEVGERSGLGFKVTQVIVALVQHGDEDEAVPAVQSSMGWIPLITADPKCEEWVRAKAREIAEGSGMKIRIARFTAREDLEVIG